MFVHEIPEEDKKIIWLMGLEEISGDCVNIEFVGININFINILCSFCSQSYQDISKSLTLTFIIFMFC